MIFLQGSDVWYVDAANVKHRAVVLSNVNTEDDSVTLDVGYIVPGTPATVSRFNNVKSFRSTGAPPYWYPYMVSE